MACHVNAHSFFECILLVLIPVLHTHGVPVLYSHSKKPHIKGNIGDFVWWIWNIRGPWAPTVPLWKQHSQYTSVRTHGDSDSQHTLVYAHMGTATASIH